MITGISVHDRVDWVFTITGMRSQGNTPYAKEVEHGAAGIIARDSIDFIGDEGLRALLDGVG